MWIFCAIQLLRFSAALDSIFISVDLVDNQVEIVKHTYVCMHAWLRVFIYEMGFMFECGHVEHGHGLNEPGAAIAKLCRFAKWEFRMVM